MTRNQDSAQPSTLVLSPHLDDAVLSAWHVLSSPGDVQVVTIYAGVPEPGFVTDLDRAHGAADSAAWLERRRAEDQAALAIAGREPIHLDLLEVQFPAYDIPKVRQAIAGDPTRFLSLVVNEEVLGTAPETLVDLVHDHLHPWLAVYGPAGIGRHPDHRDVAQAVVRLVGHVRSVHAYADSPYYLFDGLPSWIGDGPNPAADQHVDEALQALVADPARLERQVVRLDDEALARKFTAMHCYTTELPAVQADLARPGTDPDMMRYEVYWTVAGAGA